MNFQPAFRYQLKDSMKSAAIFAGVLTAIQFVTVLSFLTIARSGTREGNVTGYGIAAAIFMLVVGICSPREQMRLCIQNGTSRRTAFWSGLAVYGVLALGLAVFGELLMAVGRAVAGDGRLTQSDLYQIIYMGYGTRYASVWQCLESVLFASVLTLCACMLGSFISLVFYRLNKAWTIAVAVGVPLFFTFVLPMLATIPAVFQVLSQTAIGLFTWLYGGVWRFLLFGGLCAAGLAALCRLLSKRAPIKAAK